MNETKSFNVLADVTRPICALALFYSNLHQDDVQRMR